MTFVLLSLLATLRGIVRSRAALHIEILALRHQLHVLQRSQPRRLRLSHSDRWLWGVAVAHVAPLANGPRHREVRDGDRMASEGISAVLGLEKSSTDGPAACLSRIANSRAGSSLPQRCTTLNTCPTLTRE